VSWLLSLLGAVALGALGNLAYEILKRPSSRVSALLRRSRPARDYDPGSDGLLHVLSWSRRRPLLEKNLETELVGRLPRSHVFDVPEWQAEVAAQKARGSAGRNCYLVGLDVDHHEHPGAHVCRMRIAESDYAECMANYVTMRGGSVLAERMADLHRADIEPLLLQGPPTLFFASIVVVSPRGRVLALRRSASVRTDARKWSIGINETMKYEDEPGREEDLFALARRGLREELGLTEDDYGRIAPTWLGWSDPDCCFVGVMIVRTNISESEVEERRGSCHSVYEHDASSWLDLDRSTIKSIVAGKGTPDGKNAWLYLAPLVISETWRCLDLI
jgi:hypothetical protein